MAPGDTRAGGSDTLATRMVARAMGSVFTTGGAIALAWTLLPHGDGGDPVVLAMAMVGLATGLLLVSGLTDRMPRAFFHAALALIQVVITVGYVAAGSTTNDLRLFYVWTGPVAAFAFRPRQAALHIGWVGVALAAALAVHDAPPADEAATWLMTFGTTAVVGTVVLWLADVVKRRQADLHHAAHFDALTGLSNRTRLTEVTEEMLRRREAAGGRVVLLLTDLDRFKAVNDTRGHGTGDEVLLAIAAGLREIAPEHSVIGRVGGDEFALLVEDADGSLDTDALASALSAIWHDPLPLAAGAIHIGACVGVATSTPGDTPSSLLKDAEAAMLRAKKQGPGTIEVFRVGEREAVDRRYRIEQGLRDAAARDELRLVFQPVVEITTGRLRACEVLVRWTHPELGDVSPAEFIPVAEDHGLVGPIGTWVLEHAIAQLGRWNAAGVVPEDFRISINVSGHQLRAGLPRQIGRLLARHRVQPESIMIELTETVIISGGQETNETLTELRAMGLTLVLDDFGTGFSSLSHLQRAKFDAVKIDRSFVRGVVEAGTDRSIVGAILALADALEISVVAEGIETRAQADALRSLGCRFGQGYLFDRPLGADDFVERLTTPTLRAAGDPLTGIPAIPLAAS